MYIQNGTATVLATVDIKMHFKSIIVICNTLNQVLHQRCNARLSHGNKLFYHQKKNTIALSSFMIIARIIPSSPVKCIACLKVVNPFILYSQHHGCWLLGDARSWDFSNYGTDLVIQEYSRYGPRMVQFSIVFATFGEQHTIRSKQPIGPITNQLTM